MNEPMSRRTRRWATFALVLVVVIGIDLLRSAPGTVDSPLVFAVSVEEPGGRVLASPVVLGTQGRTVELRLVCESDSSSERMSLTLAPIGGEPEEMLYSYELSVAGRFDGARGTVRLSPGAEKRIFVHPDEPEGVTLALFAAPVKHEGLEGYLRARRIRLGLAASALHSPVGGCAAGASAAI